MIISSEQREQQNEFNLIYTVTIPVVLKRSIPTTKICKVHDRRDFA